MLRTWAEMIFVLVGTVWRPGDPFRSARRPTGSGGVRRRSLWSLVCGRSAYRRRKGAPSAAAGRRDYLDSLEMLSVGAGREALCVLEGIAEIRWVSVAHLARNVADQHVRGLEQLLARGYAHIPHVI